MANKKFTDFAYAAFNPENIVLQADPLTGAITKTNLGFQAPTFRLVYSDGQALWNTDYGYYEFASTYIDTSGFTQDGDYVEVEVVGGMTSVPASQSVSIQFADHNWGFSYGTATGELTWKMRYIRTGPESMTVISYFQRDGQGIDLESEQDVYIDWEGGADLIIYTDSIYPNNIVQFHCLVTAAGAALEPVIKTERIALVGGPTPAGSGDQTTSVTSQSDLVGISFDVEPNSTYIIDGIFRTSCAVSSTSSGTRFATVVPAGATFFNNFYGNRTSSTSYVKQNNSASGTLFGTPIGSEANSTNMIEIKGTLQTGATAGVWKLRYASAVAGQAVTIFREGSYVKMEKIL